MAGSYTLPQVKVFQEFAQTPNDVTQNLNPFVIGPNYQLIRYSDEDERADCTTGEYKGTALKLKWADGYDGSVVDKSFYRVTLENAYASFGSADMGTATCLDASDGYGTKFEFTLTSGKSLVGTDPTKMQFGTPVKAGDYLAYKATAADTSWAYTKILSVSGGTLSTAAATKEISATTKNSSGTAVDSLIKVDLSSYAGETAGTITLTVTADDTVTTTKAKLTAKSSISGVTQATAVAFPASSTAALNIGSKGIKVYATGVVAAGTYVITVSVHEPYARDTVTVSDAIPSTLSATRIVRKFDAIEFDEDSAFLDDYTDGTETGIQIAANATYAVGSVNLYVLDAIAYLTQRNLMTDHIDSVYTVTSDADITKNGLGVIHPYNPLAYALHIMLLNCATANIKYIGVKSNDAAGYAYALDRASLSTEVYAFCPLTENEGIIDSVVAHCKTMSSEENKAWRIAFFSDPTPEAADVTPKTSDTDSATTVPEKCTVSSSNILTCRPAGGSVTDVSKVADFNDGTVHVGDTVVVVNTAGIEVTTTIKEIKTRTTLLLKDAVANADTGLCSFTITHTYTDGEYVEAIAATSSRYRHHRAYNVFPNTMTTSDGYEVSGIYGAAAVCALACSVAPQQPITNVTINGFTDLPAVYSTYSRAELNTIAAGGTLILMQEKMGDTVYVRHQISTAYPDGNLNTTELSLIKNLDSISYYFANRFAPYIGRYNVSDDLLTELEGILKDGLAYLQTTTETNRLIGPQVLVDGTEIRSLYTSDEKDKVYSNVALNLPAPFNNFDLHLQVI